MEQSLNSIWTGWKLHQELGRGSHGVVYLAVHEEYGAELSSAVKVISLPDNPAELSKLQDSSIDERALREPLRNLVDEIIREIKIMKSLKGQKNVVNIEDYRVIEREDGLGCYIFIRMELLTPLNEWCECQ